MGTKIENIGTGLDRLNAVFAWWGIPYASGNGQLDGQMRRFQAFASDLQKACGEAYSNEMGTLLSANDRISHSLQEFLHCRQPPDVIAAEWNVLATVLEQASLQAKTWVELSQKVQDCCAAMAREAPEYLHPQARETASVPVAGSSEQHVAKQTRRQSAHA